MFSQDVLDVLQYAQCQPDLLLRLMDLANHASAMASTGWERCFASALCHGNGTTQTC